MENFQVYRDIQARTGGDIYIGVVGPVRTGKSTFIRRFMELVALPGMDEKMQKEVRDQLPLSGSGKMITTVEPKFIPKEAVSVDLGEDRKAKVRLIDCVGFLVKDAGGNVEDGKERMVKTQGNPLSRSCKSRNRKGYPGTFYDRSCDHHRWKLWRNSKGKFCSGRGTDCG